MTIPTNHGRHARHALAILAVGLLAAARAQAQDSAAAPAGDAPAAVDPAASKSARTAQVPGLGARDMALLMRVLQLDDGQAAVIRVMLEDQGGGTGEGSALVAPALDAGIRALLNEEQLKAWPEVERTLRRERLLGEGVLPGESLNVTLVLEGMVPRGAWSAEMNDAAMRHSQDLDAMLLARSAGPRLEGAAAHALRKSIRDLNLALVETLAAQLPADRAEAFRAEIVERSYPTVFARTNGEQILLDMDDPAFAAMAARIESIRTEYRTRMQAVRKAARAAVDARANADQGSPDAIAAAKEKVAASEKAFGDAERWLATSLAAAVDLNTVPAGAGSSRIAEWLRFERASASKAWGNAAAMLEIFDRDRDGQLSDEEQQAAFETYTHQVGARVPRRL
jgi:hypothetical protein